MEREVYNLAFDFGASSGRAILGKFDGEKIELEEIHRFPNEPVRIGKYLYWDFLRLFHELKIGLKNAAAKGVEISSIGIDTWGVDYGLIDKDGNLLSCPVHYRDTRTDNCLQEIQDILPYSEIYDITGIQYMQFNTLFQFFADMKQRPHILKEAKALLFMPDLFSYFLTGNMYSEYTIASTSQMMMAGDRNWAMKLLKKLNLPVDILQKIIMPGQVCGTLTEDIEKEVGLESVKVISVAGHDTASAVVATPFEGEDKVFLSSGTWSLLGMEIDSPIINKSSSKYDFTNEGGVDGKIRFLKNINGTWIIQRLRNCWSENVERISFTDIIKAAKEAQNKDFAIDPNHKSFNSPLDMADTIQKYCINAGQGKPETLGEIAIAVYNGLAKEYKRVIESLQEVIGKEISKINMIGGGIQDEFLCQLTSDATGKEIVAGPIEASALGNVVMQLRALGYVKNLEEGRKIIKNSIVEKRYFAREDKVR